jgi:hypothetical protein
LGARLTSQMCAALSLSGTEFVEVLNVLEGVEKDVEGVEEA